MQNMVGPGEVDEDLEPETAEECSKYGKVTKVVIYEVGGTAYWREGGRRGCIQNRCAYYR